MADMTDTTAAEAKASKSPAYRTFDEFWPFYVSEHSHPTNRALHFVGTGLALLSLGTFAATRKKRFLAAAPVMGYLFAWIGHYLVEKNRPATFTYPGKSLRGDFIMFGLMAARRMGPELDRAEALHGNKHKAEADHSGNGGKGNRRDA